MDVLRLRTLTRKSVMGFGKFYYMTVRQILAQDDCTHEARLYLMWVYYNVSKISFVDSVLKSIGIYEKHRIDKPGTKPEMFDTLSTAMYEELRRRWLEEGDLTYIKMMSRLRKKRKMHEIHHTISDLCAFNKRAMQEWNHGHRNNKC
jgi:hypothetical protein